MFEKEAEEYSNNWKINKNNDLNFAELVELRAVIYKAYKDGAEFGFQKGIKARINTTTISDCPIKDEWHYPSKGELPEKTGRYLILNRFGEHYFTTNITEYLEGAKMFSRFSMEDVYAWKEIVLPKEIE